MVERNLDKLVNLVIFHFTSEYQGNILIHQHFTDKAQGYQPAQVHLTARVNRCYSTHIKFTQILNQDEPTGPLKYQQTHQPNRRNYRLSCGQFLLHSLDYKHAGSIRV